MEKINKLPKNARYDYTDDFGYKYYHTERRKYRVREIGTKGSYYYKKEIFSERR